MGRFFYYIIYELYSYGTNTLETLSPTFTIYTADGSSNFTLPVALAVEATTRPVIS